ncbi:MAG: ribosomal L7Ae/L30e/S12e/Gadd45 family protein [Clostridia bacterium]
MSKILSLLGLCRRAGKLSSGFDSTMEALKKPIAKLVVVSKEISPKTLENIEFNAKKVNVPLIIIDEDILEISKAIGKKAGVLAVTSKDFAKGIHDAYKKEISQTRKDDCNYDD